MGFGGRLAHRSCLCMGENEPILYVMASRTRRKKNIAFFFVGLPQPCPGEAPSRFF